MSKREELITVRIEPKWKERIKALERERIETSSNIIREALIKYLQKEAELRKIKEFN
jgi:predicted transcriptional regulator